jgi:hypothetical protein
MCVWGLGFGVKVSAENTQNCHKKNSLEKISISSPKAMHKTLTQVGFEESFEGVFFLFGHSRDLRLLQAQ